MRPELKKFLEETWGKDCVFGINVRRALYFSIKTHEIYQKQKRRGKDIPYISHPLTVGLALALGGASEEVVIAGILHDTIEDSIPEKQVTRALLLERFSPEVVDIVEDVTEKDKSLPWKQRKERALKHIQYMPIPSLWVKTADVVCNVSELLDDHYRLGENVFKDFHAGKPQLLENHAKVLTALIRRWESLENEAAKSPFLCDLKTLLLQVEKLR